MDATRSRRTRDDGRRLWYASHRQRRFARFVWGLSPVRAPSPAQGCRGPTAFGGIINGSLGAVTVIDSTFTGNSAGLSGGGDNFGSAMISGSTFRRNTAGSGNGGLNNEPGALLTQFDNRFLDDQPPDVFA